MITYFDEKDLISFANYCLSPLRRKIFIEQGISEDKVDELLKTVNPADLKNWFNIVIKQRQQEDLKIQTEKENEN
jgi:hypothetical protein